jgi:hypothetical protein
MKGKNINKDTGMSMLEGRWDHCGVALEKDESVIVQFGKGLPPVNRKLVRHYRFQSHLSALL